MYIRLSKRTLLPVHWEKKDYFYFLKKEKQAYIHAVKLPDLF